MIPLSDILERIELAKQRYDVCKLSLASDQMEILREFTICYDDLTHHLTEEKETFREFYYNNPEKTHAARQRYADKECPELEKIKDVMKALEKLIDCCRSTLSKAKI